MATTIFAIRTGVPTDLAALDALLARSYPILLKPDYPPSVMVTALPLIAQANPALLRTGTYFVAETPEGALVGAGGWTRAGPAGATAGRAGIGNIRHLVTDHRRLRSGIARAIMDRVFLSARAARVSRLECLSTRTAVPFYRSVGFEAIGEVEVALRPGIGFPAVAMRRDI